jgi:NAD(P)-dependent dehydrogenase (short-subunit alcohol dehydrogenase family)
MSYWNGKTAVVTGGSSGLGAALVEELVRNQAGVVAVARGSERLEALCETLAPLGGSLLPVTADVTDGRDVERVVGAALERFGSINLVINCAGRSARSAVLDVTPDELQALWEINVLATVHMTRACASHLLQSKGPYTQQLRLEMSRLGVHVMLVCPGPISREDEAPRYGERAGVPSAAHRPAGGAKLRRLDPHRLARDILYACERRRPEVVRPRTARLLFVAAAVSPRLGDWLVRRFTVGSDSSGETARES